MTLPRPPRIYICGPMRGHPQLNFPAFQAAKGLLQALGWIVVSPVDLGRDAFNNDPDVPGWEYLRVDIKALCDCTAIALLPGWRASTGARCEVVVAITLNLMFYDAQSGARMDRPKSVTCNGGYEMPPGEPNDVED